MEPFRYDGPPHGGLRNTTSMGCFRLLWLGLGPEWSSGGGELLADWMIGWSTREWAKEM